MKYILMAAVFLIFAAVAYMIAKKQKVATPSAAPLTVIDKPSPPGVDLK